jgi:hypothetical protein
MISKHFRDLAESAPAAAARRGERLAVGYLEAELVLHEQGIHQTIVVFGGTRIRELSEAPPEGIPDYYRLAREFGEIVGRSGQGPEDSRLTLMTGGGPGIMEAANRGASEVGAKSIGLNIKLPREQFPNAYVTKELCFNFRYFAIRKLHFLLRAKALVVFPGGFGTLDELFETLNLVQTRKIKRLPVVLVGEEFWRGAINPEYLIARGVVDPEDLDLFWYAETAQQAWDGVIQWHRDAGSPLLCDTEAAR